MSAPIPQYVWSSSTAVVTVSADTLSNLGFAATDLLVVVQSGTASGAGAPVAPTAPTGLNGGAKTSGTDAYANVGVANDGRVQVWSKILVSGDLSSTVTVSATGFTTQYFSIWRIPGFWDDKRVYSEQDSISNTGSTPFSITDTNRDLIVITALGAITTAAAATITYDGATSGTKFQRSPYVNSSGSSTQTDGAHGHHYSSNRVISQTDYQEYAASDTVSSVLWNNNVSNTTHAVVVVVYQQVVQAPGGVATGTGQALDARPSVFANAGLASATGVANDPTVSLIAATLANAGLATATGVANNPAPNVKVNAGLASATGTANNAAQLKDFALPIIATKTWSSEVSVTDPTIYQAIEYLSILASKNYPGDAGDIMFSLKQGGTVLQSTSWIALTGTPTRLTLTLSSPAEGTGFSVLFKVRTTSAVDPLISDLQVFVGPIPITATGTGTANTPSISINLSPGLSSAVGAAYITTSNVQPNAGLPSGVAAARTPSVQVFASAGVATGTGVAAQVGVNVMPSSGLATATATANNSAQTLITVNPAQAIGTGAALVPSPVNGTFVTPGVATGSGIANNPNMAIISSIGVASAVGSANNPIAAVSVMAGYANAIGIASDVGGMLISPYVQAIQATGTAQNPVAAIAITAGFGTGVGTGNSPSISLAPNASTAMGTALANTPSLTIPNASFVIAGLATAIGTAHNPAISIMPNARVAQASGLAKKIATIIIIDATHSGKPSKIQRSMDLLIKNSHKTEFGFSIQRPPRQV